MPNLQEVMDDPEKLRQSMEHMLEIGRSERAKTPVGKAEAVRAAAQALNDAILAADDAGVLTLLDTLPTNCKTGEITLVTVSTFVAI